MRAMRSSLPVFIFIGLALIATIGIIIFGSVATTAVAEVNNSSTEELPLAIYDVQFGVMFGVAALLFLLAIYFVLKNFG